MARELTGWREYVEAHAVTGRLLRLIAWLAPRGPHPRDVHRAPSQRPHASETLVSVVVPCYNYAHYLEAAVVSALTQPGVDVEVIIVDDQSTDDSYEVAQRLATEHRNVRAFRNSENLGHVRSFNRGWEESSGALVVKLDADDMIATGALARAASVFEAHPRVGLVYGHPRHFETSEPPIGRVGEIRWTIWTGTDWLAERCKLGVSAITNPEMVLRSSLLSEYGPMDPHVPYAPDMEISLRLAGVADVAFVGGADQALHREHSGSMSENAGSGALVDLHARADAFARGIPDEPASHPRTLFSDAARQALARDAMRYASSAADNGRPSADVSSFLDFAQEQWPPIRSSRTYSTLVRWCDQRTRRPGGPFRKVGRRFRSELFYVRWVVTGS